MNPNLQLMNTRKSFSVMFVLISMTLTMQACVFDVNAIRGDGNISTEQMNLDPFDEVHVSGMFNVILVEGNNPHISIETDENIQEFVVAEVRNNILTLRMKEDNRYDPTRLEVHVTTNSLSELKLSGATSLSSDHTLSSEDLTISISGAGDMDLKVNAEKLKTMVSGAGNVKISGKAEKHQIKISGVASMNCLNLETLDTDVSISGAGSAKVNATQKINASVSGVGSIEYSGNPQSKQLSTSGAGSIKSI
jgi:hypothetical protein